MPSFNTINLLTELKNEVVEIIATTERLKLLDNVQLNQQPEVDKWSVAQVIEHLNTYNDYYLPQLQKALATSQHKANPVFKPRMLGEYFTNSMLPKANGQLKNKMKAFKAHVPAASLNGRDVLDKFIEAEKTLVDILELAAQKDINKILIPISISNWIRLRAGDTFRFLIAHQQRHFVQIANTLKFLNISTGISFTKP